MGNKKLISMLMLSAGFAACTQDELVENNYAGNENQKDLIEDVAFNVTLDKDAVTRGQYAGGSDKVFTNFYLEPEYNNEELYLSDIAALRGDMIGLCLTNGTQAITNYPFYIAGYGSLKSELETAKDTVYVFADQESGNSLYKLGLTEQVAVQATKGLIQESIDSMKKLPGNTLLAVTKLDARKGIVRTNTGIMSGNYVAYYPYNDEFAEVGAIPVKEIEAMVEVGDLSSKTFVEAIEGADFYDNLFAVSTGLAEVTGKTKVGNNLSLKPLTGLITFNLKNTNAENSSKEIKRVVVTAAENAAETDFILGGTVSLDARETIIPAEGKTTSMIGVSFNKTQIAPTGAEDSLFVSIPCYPNLNGKKIIIEVYSTDGMVGRFAKNTVPAMGTSVTYTLDLNPDSVVFEETLRKVFTPSDFIDEVVSGGEIELMQDIVIHSEFTMKEDSRPLVIKGDKILQLYNGTVNQDITMEDGKLYLGDNFVSEKNITANFVMLQEAYAGKGVSGEIKANRLELGPTTANVTLKNKLDVEELSLTNRANQKYPMYTLKNATVGTMINATGTVVCDSVVTVGTLKNDSVLTVKALTVTELKNTTAGTVTVEGSLVAATINNGATFTVNEDAVVSEAVLYNGEYGTFIWNTSEDMPLTVVNEGTFNITKGCDLTADITNNGKMSISGKVYAFEVGTTIENNDTLTIAANSALEMNGSMLNVNAGSWVEVEGELNGSDYITCKDGADIVYSVTTANKLEDALSGQFVYKTYTGLKISGTVTTWPNNINSTDKKLYLYKDITFNTSNLKLNGGVEICEDINVNVSQNVETTDITVGEGKELTLAGNKNLTVSGDVTIAEDATMDIDNTGTTKVLGKFTGEGTLDLDRGVSTVQGKYDRTLTIANDTPVN